MSAHETYGSLGELAILVLPQAQLASIIKRLDLSAALRGVDASGGNWAKECPDLMAAVIYEQLLSLFGF